MVWYGMAWHGMAWRGVAWHGIVVYTSRCTVSCGLVYGMQLYGVWYGVKHSISVPFQNDRGHSHLGFSYLIGRIHSKIL